MSFVGMAPMLVYQAGLVLVPATRRPMRPQNLEVYSRGVLPTDALGNCSLTLENVVVGSRYRIEVASTGALVAEGTATQSTIQLTVPYFAPGAPENTVRVRVRKGTTAPKYQPYESQTVLSAQGALVFVSQVPDPIA